MDNPERRAQQGDVLNEDAFALVEVDHLGTQPVGGTKAALVHGDTIFSLLEQTGTGSHVLGNAALLHTELLAATPRPPCLVGTAAVNGSLTRNGNVLSLIGIDEWREVPAVQTLPAGGYDGVQLGFESKLQHGTILNDEVDTRLQLDGCRQEFLSGRHYHATTALLRALVDGLLDSLLVFGCGVSCLCTILCDDIRLVGKLRHADALLNLLVLLLIPTLCLCRQGSDAK